MRVNRSVQILAADARFAVAAVGRCEFLRRGRRCVAVAVAAVFVCIFADGGHFDRLCLCRRFGRGLGFGRIQHQFQRLVARQGFAVNLQFAFHESRQQHVSQNLRHLGQGLAVAADIVAVGREVERYGQRFAVKLDIAADQFLGNAVGRFAALQQRCVMFGLLQQGFGDADADFGLAAGRCCARFGQADADLFVQIRQFLRVDVFAVAASQGLLLCRGKRLFELGLYGGGVGRVLARGGIGCGCGRSGCVVVFVGMRAGGQREAADNGQRNKCFFHI